MATDQLTAPEAAQDSAAVGSATSQGADRSVDPKTGYNQSVYLLAVVLTSVVFPLIWVGGLVTTYDAGMAVPDWPGTYGWNMFAYPVTTWLFGPFDLLVEHSHRLLGSLAGFLSIGLVIQAWRHDQRRWFTFWSVGVLLAVIAQGALGGARVVLDQRTLAMIHGCTGPLFFAIATATAVMSSRWWIEGRRSLTDNAILGRVNGWIVWGATGLLVSAYLQLIIGAQLRHLTGAVPIKLFKVFVHSHLTMAGLVFVLAIMTALATLIGKAITPRVRRPAILAVGLVFIQIALGIGTWVVNYALPWPELYESLAAYTILAKGFWESLIVTAHVATGSLIISLSVVVALRAWRTRTISASSMV
ncbi:MAG: COX15/CtaA family protein [Aureliella sp.]